MTSKPILMILGSYHMHNPGKDLVNFEADDVLAPKRQAEIKQLVRQLKKFKPTKVLWNILLKNKPNSQRLTKSI